MPPNDDPYHNELRRRDANSSTVAPIDTIDGQLGAWMQWAMEQNSNPALNDDVANSDLDTSVANEERSLKARKRSPLPFSRFRAHELNELKPYLYPRAQPTGPRDWSSSWSENSSSLAYALGSASGASGCASGTVRPTGFANTSKYSSIPSQSRSASQTHSLGKEAHRSMRNVSIQAAVIPLIYTTPITFSPAPSVRTSPHQEVDTHRMAPSTSPQTHHGQNSFSPRRHPLQCLSLIPTRELKYKLVYRPSNLAGPGLESQAPNADGLYD